MSDKQKPAAPIVPESEAARIVRPGISVGQQPSRPAAPPSEVAGILGSMWANRGK
jgi:hypothetical protein